MHTIIRLIYVFVLALIFALWEIQIEGKNGWAANLPTWRKTKGVINRMTGGRPLTGYHFLMNIFLTSVFHLIFLFESWDFEKELLILILLMIFFLVEDFLWFVLNPAYGLKNFKKGRIWWHPQWIGPLPKSYYLGIIFILLLVFVKMVL